MMLKVLIHTLLLVRKGHVLQLGVNAQAEAGGDPSLELVQGFILPLELEPKAAHLTSWVH